MASTANVLVDDCHAKPAKHLTTFALHPNGCFADLFVGTGCKDVDGRELWSLAERYELVELLEWLAERVDESNFCAVFEFALIKEEEDGTGHRDRLVELCASLAKKQLAEVKSASLKRLGGNTVLKILESCTDSEGRMPSSKRKIEGSSFVHRWTAGRGRGMLDEAGMDKVLEMLDLEKLTLSEMVEFSEKPFFIELLSPSQQAKLWKQNARYNAEKQQKQRQQNQGGQQEQEQKQNRGRKQEQRQMMQGRGQEHESDSMKANEGEGRQNNAVQGKRQKQQQEGQQQQSNEKNGKQPGQEQEPEEADKDVNGHSSPGPTFCKRKPREEERPKCKPREEKRPKCKPREEERHKCKKQRQDQQQQQRNGKHLQRESEGEEDEGGSSEGGEEEEEGEGDDGVNVEDGGYISSSSDGEEEGDDDDEAQRRTQANSLAMFNRQRLAAEFAAYLLEREQQTDAEGWSAKTKDGRKKSKKPEKNRTSLHRICGEVAGEVGLSHGYSWPAQQPNAYGVGGPPAHCS